MKSIADIQGSSPSRSLTGNHPSKKRRPLGSLATNNLLSEARRRTGLRDFEDPDIESRLSLLVNSIEAEARLHLRGKFLARMHLQNLLETRLRLVRTWQTLEALQDQPINRPVFITGMPRSGSTFLHELFVEDPENRGPLVWEVMNPPRSIPVDSKEAAQRIKESERCLWWFRQIAPRADAVHPMRALTPHECVAIQSYAFLSHEFITTFRIPTYAEYLNKADFRPAYVWEKRFLQFLQWRSPMRRWVLKAPDHVFSIDALFDVFPDAVIVQMHRNPLEVLKSSKGLIEVIREVFAHLPDDDQIQECEAQALSTGMDRISRFRDCHPELANRFIDVFYPQLIEDPLGTLRHLYERMEWGWNSTVADKVQTLASRSVRYSSARPQTAARYPFSDKTINPTRFTDYCARFGIQMA